MTDELDFITLIGDDEFKGWARTFREKMGVWPTHIRIGLGEDERALTEQELEWLKED